MSTIATSPLWLQLITWLLVIKPRIPWLRDRVWSAKVRIGSEARTFEFRDRSELRALGEVFLDEEYALSDPPVVRKVLDLGANAGQANLYFQTQFPDATVYSVEPDPLNFELLTRNVGSDANVHVLRYAVTAEPGPVTLQRGAMSWASRIGSEGEGVVVSGKTLDQLIAEVGGDVDLLKVDVEGLEHDVLMASDRLSEIPLVVGEVHAEYLSLPVDDALRMWKERGGFTTAHRSRSNLFQLSR